MPKKRKEPRFRSFRFNEREPMPQIGFKAQEASPRERIRLEVSGERSKTCEKLSCFWTHPKKLAHKLRNREHIHKFEQFNLDMLSFGPIWVMRRERSDQANEALDASMAKDLILRFLLSSMRSSAS
jgi:hypothetical protein